jgi:hypothetical protein
MMVGLRGHCQRPRRLELAEAHGGRSEGGRMMFIANLLVLVALGLADQPDPTALVEQLGSGRYARREAAAAALEKLGSDALPALREALASKDPEVRSRAAVLIEKIDSELLTRPTLIKLDFSDVALSDIAQKLSAESGISILLEPVNHPMWKTRKVTLHEPEPVPFWKAVDLLGQAGGLVPNPATQMGDMGRSPVLRLYSGVIVPVPTSDSGPFRVSLTSVHHHRDLMLSQVAGVQVPVMVAPVPEQAKVKAANGGQPAAAPPPPPVPAQRLANDQFYAQMQVMVEPRLMLSNSNELKLTEAVDDQGQSLLLPSAPGQAQRYSAYFGFSPGGLLQLPIHMKYPEQPGKVIKKLKGVLPVTVSARKPDPLVVPLNTDSLEKQFRNSDAQVTIHEVKADAGNQRSTVTVSVRLLGQQGDRDVDLGMGVGPRLAQIGQNQIEIVDAKGKTLHGFTSTQASTRAQADEVKFQVTLMPLPDTGAPAELRYYSLTRATADVPFEFTDIPMP